MSDHDQIAAKLSIYTALVNSVEKYGQRVALIDQGGQGERLTYADLLMKVDALASLLASANFASQPEIGLISANGSAWVIAYLAIQAAGKTVVPIDANLKPNEIGYIIDHADLKTVICSGRFETELAGLASELAIISLAADSSNHYVKFIAGCNCDEVTLPEKVNSCAVLIYTSGTTGNPKAVELTHENILGNLDGVQDTLIIYEHDIFLSVLPLHHTFEATCGFLLPLISGSTIVYARSLKSKEIVEDIKINQVTILIGVPLLFEKMYHSIRRAISKSGTVKKSLFSCLFGISVTGWNCRLKLGKSLFKSMRQKAGLNSIRMFVSGGAALPQQVCRFFNCLGFGMIQGYGLTETSPVLTAHRLDDIRFGSVGSPLSNIEMKIDQPSAEGIGEIIVRGPNITRGYRGNAEETARLLKDGWLRTGDLGRMKNGHLWITGRQKNVIVSAAGKNIYPEELEERLLSSLLITEGVIFGRLKEGKPGEEVRAIIVPDLEQFQTDYDLSVENPDMAVIRQVIGDLLKRINSEIASYKRIAGFDIQLTELEKTSTKKVKRFLYK